MAETSTATFSTQASQTGSQTDATTWAEDTMTGGQSGVHRIGVQFDISTERGSAPDPDQYKFLTLTMTALSASASSGDIYDIYLEDAKVPAAFSSSDLPSDRTLLQVGSYTTTTTDPATAGTVEFRFGSDYAAGTYTSNPTWVANLQTIYGKNWASSDWTGLVSMVLIGDTAAAAVEPVFDDRDTTEPTMTSTLWSFHTGHNKAAPGDRAVHCQRSGRAVGAGSLQSDGYLPGIWVTSDHWDPEDSRRRPPQPSSTERERQDEVPE